MLGRRRHRVRLKADTTKWWLGTLLLALLTISCGSGGGGISGCSMPVGVSVGTGTASEVLVVRNFTLIDGGDRAPVAQAAMLVDDGRVVWAGPESELKAPDGAEVTDLNGAYVIPGLINVHAHLGNTVDLVQDKKFHTRESVEKDLKTFASYGVTTVVSMGTDQDTIFPVRKEIRDSGTPSMARVYTAGQGLMFDGGYGGLAGVNDAVASPEEAAAYVNAQLDKGADFIKLWLDSELGTMPKMPPAITQAI